MSELPSREELIEKICLLEAYVLTLENANQSKYDEVCLQGRMLNQLREENSKLKNKGAFPSYAQAELQQRLQKSTQMCTELQKENQKLKRRLTELQKEKPLLRSSRAKDRSISPQPRESTHRLIVDRSARQQSAANVFNSLKDSYNYQSKRVSKYSFNPETMIPTKIRTSPIIELESERAFPLENEDANQQRSLQNSEGTFSFSNLQDSFSMNTVVHERSRSKQEQRNFRKLAYHGYKPQFGDSRARRGKN